MTLVDWPTLREWCMAHGAKNDRIIFIQIAGRAETFHVILEGWELNDEGRPFYEGIVPAFSEGIAPDLARWRTVQPLRSLPC